MSAENDLYLTEPNSQLLTSYYEACRETWGYVHNDYIIHNPDSFEQWRNTIFDDFENQKNGINLPNGYVPSVTFWAVSKGKYIGTVNIRLQLTEKLIDYGGNIGIAVRKSERRKGYAAKILALAVDTAKKLGVSPVVATCTDTNEGSLRLLCSANFKRTETAQTFADGVFCKVHKFFF